MGKKPSSSFAFLFRRLNGKSSISNPDGERRRRRKSATSAGFRWKRRFSLRHWLIDTCLFKIVSILEAVVLVSRLCFFFLCCGCKF
ncbi:uncharacterized protein LOC127254769 [Andrographis paniculata]|uniref:uncharacterized protein LOC127254769 n=1 Tax=Andrographis paniculata TaxID=175694 RepID=UPI0021E7C9C7|nr:uncharacterized protein LOC127254769 [Andrographis paniculata]